MNDGFTIVLSAADFISMVEEASADNVINNEDYSVMIEDLSDILNKMNEKPGESFNISKEGLLLVINNENYKRLYKNQVLVEEYWNKSGTIHRDGDKPAYMRYYENSGKIKTEQWYQNGRIKRDGGKPQSIRYDRYGEPEEYLSRYKITPSR